MKSVFSSIIAVFFALATPSYMASAHDDHEGHEHGKQMSEHKHEHEHGDHKHGKDHGHHGGQYMEIAGHHGVEMVTGKDHLTFYMTEDHKEMDLTGAQFRAVIQTEQTEAGTKILPLTAKGHALTTPLDNPLPKGTKIALTGKDNTGHLLQARFVKK